MLIENIIKSIFWDPNEKKINLYKKMLLEFKKKEELYKDFSEQDLKDKTNEFRELFKDLDFKKQEDWKKIKEILEDIKLDAFALVKQACKLLNWKTFKLASWKELKWEIIPYDVQIIWWLSIHDWTIAEMKTWEWKTLVATLPAYLNALTWNPVHIVTVNDYLASRDFEEMWVLYNMLWLESGVIMNSQSKSVKAQNYKKDVVYATNNELGFDYLKDNMVIRKDDKVQSRLFFAIIDEVDSILIDEARTPLIISMPDNEPTSKYSKFATLARSLEKWKDYKIDEKQKTATLTEDGIKKIEWYLKIDNIYVSNQYNDLHHIENSLKAVAVYKKDKDYIISNDEVMIVDEHTWRVLSWRRYSDWLHQAIEAKENVTIKQESRTLASITFQNFFRMYWKLSWMTWTAKTEEEEFYKVYALETLVIPTNKPILRDDKKDLLFKNEKWKFDYVIKLIKEYNKKWAPILVWTVSVDKSEYLSDRLRQEWVKHNVLNAKQHEKEAEVIANAWQEWAVTIATNMAWRWTDIKLWEWVKELGWLIIIWTEKHETRRIDNQLRWRSWRQWDPWITQFLISPNDDIMRIFWWDKLFWVFNSPMFASLPDEEPLTQSSMLTRRVTWVQKQVEWHNFDVRKHILEYDDVMNKHREIIYSKRNKILDSENIHDDIKNMITSQITALVLAEFEKEKSMEDKSIIIKKVNDFIWIEIIDDKIENDDIKWISDWNSMATYISDIAIWELEKLKLQYEDEDKFLDIERRIVLQSIDELWMRHIDNMTKLREEVAFEWYAQKNPLVVYKEKAFYKFNNLIWELEYKVVKAIYSVNLNDKVEQVKLPENNFDINEAELEWLLNSFWWNNNSNSQKQTWTNTNPLFANPNNNTRSNNVNNSKTKIRV